tara:strand:- start:713 stop:853 length:141 start_codon:yes stop_codon:yes gene_type:complete
MPYKGLKGLDDKGVYKGGIFPLKKGEGTMRQPAKLYGSSILAIRKV